MLSWKKQSMHHFWGVNYAFKHLSLKLHVWHCNLFSLLNCSIPGVFNSVIKGWIWFKYSVKQKLTLLSCTAAVCWKSDKQSFKQVNSLETLISFPPGVQIGLDSSRFFSRSPRRSPLWSVQILWMWTHLQPPGCLQRHERGENAWPWFCVEPPRRASTRPKHYRTSTCPLLWPPQPYPAQNHLGCQW